MTDTEIKYTIRRSSAIIATCIDVIFHWPPCSETAELCDRITGMLEVVNNDLAMIYNNIKDE